MLSKCLKKQRGAISILGVGSIILSLFAFIAMVDYVNAKILDRELDNYARTIAATALRSELALIAVGKEDDEVTNTQTTKVTNAILDQVEKEINKTIESQIVFGNFDVAKCNSTVKEERLKCFVPLPDAVKFNPASAPVGPGNPPPEFSAVAVQLKMGGGYEVSNSEYNAISPLKDVFNFFKPEGRALYGATSNDDGCFCHNRYKKCLDSDLSTVGAGKYSDINVGAPYSASRRAYCKYGYTPSKPGPGNADKKKYPWEAFPQYWVGVPPETTQANLLGLVNLYSQGVSYEGTDNFAKVLTHKPVTIVDGKDPIYAQSGVLGLVDNITQGLLVTNLLGLTLPDDGMYARKVPEELALGLLDLNVLESPNFYTKQDLVDEGLPLDEYQCGNSLGVGAALGLDLDILNSVADTSRASSCGSKSALGVLDDLLIEDKEPVNCGLLGLGCVVGGLLDSLVGNGGLLNALTTNLLDGVLSDVLTSVTDPVLETHRPVVLDDQFYVGEVGICIAGTSGVGQSKSRCLAYGTSASPVYESCNSIMKRADLETTLSQRLMGMLFGSSMSYERAYEALDCEMKKMTYKGGLLSDAWE